MQSKPVYASGVEARRIACLFPSFRDFCDDALFHPQWGYYSTGQVRFGEGGDYDTFPIALSPIFGRMLARYTYRFWRRAGQPAEVEICELGAGNGQLCQDVLVHVLQPLRQSAAWTRFAAALRYRIIERSPALIERQRQTLGPLGVRVRWVKADLSQHPARRAPFAACGIVFGNEVLDCLAHHKIVPHADGTPGVVFVVPTLSGRGGPRDLDLLAGLQENTRAVPYSQLARVLSDAKLRRQVSFQEAVLPIDVRPELARFMRFHYPELFRRKARFQPYFACPRMESLIRNTARLYPISEALWIDYGELRDFHLATGEGMRVFAGPPRSGVSVYRDPGRDDITFMVDFSVVEAAAAYADWRVAYFGGQRELARRSGVKLDRRIVGLIVQQRMLSWMLAVFGVGPERSWRQTGLTWNKRAGKGGRVRTDARHAVEEFLGQRHSYFKLMLLRPA